MYWFGNIYSEHLLAGHYGELAFVLIKEVSAWETKGGRYGGESYEWNMSVEL